MNAVPFSTPPFAQNVRQRLAAWAYVVLTLGGGVVGTAQSSLPEPLRIVVDEGRAPFSYRLHDGSASGLHVELWRTWSAETDLPITLEALPADVALAQTRQGLAVYGGLVVEPHHDWAEFSAPIGEVELGVLLAPRLPADTLVAHRSDLALGVVAGSVGQRWLDRERAEMPRSTFPTLETALYALLAEEIEAVLGLRSSLAAEASRLQLSPTLHLTSEVLETYAVAAATHGSKRSWLDRLDQGLATLPLGTLAHLEQRWLPHRQPPFGGEGRPAALTLAEQRWLDEHPVLDIGVDTAWYPFEFVDDRGEFQGISASYVDYASESLGIEFRPHFDRPWTQLFDEFKAGDLDMLTAVVATEERALRLHFTEPYFVAPTVIVTRKNAFYAESMEGLTGRRVGLVRGFAIVELVTRDYPGIEIVLVDTIVDGLEQLDRGELDAYVGTLSVVNYELQRHKLGNLLVAGFSPYQFQISMTVRDGLEPLATILDKTFASMDERQRAAIVNDWLAIHVQTGADLGAVLVVAVPLLGLLVAIILIIGRFNRNLQREIARRVEVERELEHLAGHDELTGLPNRRLFDELSEQALRVATRQGHPQALLIVDIDGFKKVNDSFGHPAGDRLLAELAGRLSATVRRSDIVARLGGDEFVVLLDDSCDRPAAERLASLVVDRLSEPFRIDETTTRIGASVGIALFPEHGAVLSKLIRHADAAMYEAKRSGKSTFRVFEPSPTAP